MTASKATLRSKAGAAAVLVLASAPLTLMVWRLYQHFGLSQARPDSLALYEVESFLLYLTLTLLTYSVVAKRLTATLVTFAMWSAGVCSQTDNLIALARNASITTLPTQSLLPEPGMLLPPQAPLAMCFSMLVVLMCMVPFKRFRSIDRLYVISIGTFVLSTMAIFSSTLHAGLQEQVPIVSNTALDMMNSAAHYREATDRFRRMLATMNITVHSAWIVASLIGLAIHKTNIAQRAHEQRTIDDYVEKRFYEFIQG
jgi:hypothetical protein